MVPFEEEVWTKQRWIDLAKGWLAVVVVVAVLIGTAVVVIGGPLATDDSNWERTTIDGS